MHSVSSSRSFSNNNHIQTENLDLASTAVKVKELREKLQEDKVPSADAQRLSQMKTAKKEATLKPKIEHVQNVVADNMIVSQIQAKDSQSQVTSLSRHGSQISNQAQHTSQSSRQPSQSSQLLSSRVEEYVDTQEYANFHIIPNSNIFDIEDIIREINYKILKCEELIEKETNTRSKIDITTIMSMILENYEEWIKEFCERFKGGKSFHHHPLYINFSNVSIHIQNKENIYQIELYKEFLRELDEMRQQGITAISEGAMITVSMTAPFCLTMHTISKVANQVKYHTCPPSNSELTSDQFEASLNSYQFPNKIIGCSRWTDCWQTFLNNQQPIDLPQWGRTHIDKTLEFEGYHISVNSSSFDIEDKIREIDREIQECENLKRKLNDACTAFDLKTNINVTIKSILDLLEYYKEWIKNQRKRFNGEISVSPRISRNFSQKSALIFNKEICGQIELHKEFRRELDEMRQQRQKSICAGAMITIRLKQPFCLKMCTISKVTGGIRNSLNINVMLPFSNGYQSVEMQNNLTKLKNNLASLQDQPTDTTCLKHISMLLAQSAYRSQIPDDFSRKSLRE